MAVALALPVIRNRAATLSMAALGIGLVVLVGITWGTGILYIISRLGLPSPVRLAVVDSIHIYVGIAAAAFFGLKVWRVGFRRNVAGVPSLTLWQRWVSWSLVVLYPAIFLTGLAAVLPFGAGWKIAMVQAHLLTSVWSLVPTTLHLLHHRSRAASQLIAPRTGRIRPRLWAGIALVVLPTMLWLPFPHAVSPAAEAGAGGHWAPTGLQGVFLDQISVSADGRHLIAAGDGVYVSDSRGRTWHHLDVGGYSADAHAQEPAAIQAPSSAVAHPGHAVPAGSISTLTVAQGPVAIYAGSSDGIYDTPDLATPLTRDHFPGGEVRAIAVDPANPYERWVASGSGIWFTWVFGHGWTLESDGLSNPNGASALAFYHKNLYASDLLGIYRWDEASSAWKLVSAIRGVISLSANADVLVADSYSSGIATFNGRTWRPVGSGLPAHAHASGNGAQVHGVAAPASGGLFVVTDGAIGMSLDGGRSWNQLASGLPDSTAAVTRWGDTVYAATGDGLYADDLQSAPQDTPAWWLGIIAVAVIAALAGVAVVHRRRQTRTSARSGRSNL